MTSDEPSLVARTVGWSWPRTPTSIHPPSWMQTCSPLSHSPNPAALFSQSLACLCRNWVCGLKGRGIHRVGRRSWLQRTGEKWSLLLMVGAAGRFAKLPKERALPVWISQARGSLLPSNQAVWAPGVFTLISQHCGPSPVQITPRYNP